jgi:hypothetical protein
MPPCHGKTYRHGFGRLREADVLCHPRASPLLDTLRTLARQDAVFMDGYVKLWAWHLAAAAHDGDVVMVPDVDVAVSAGFIVTRALLLDECAWISNMRSRKLSKLPVYRECYSSVLRSGVPVVVCDGNEELTRELTIVVDSCV